MIEHLCTITPKGDHYQITCRYGLVGMAYSEWAQRTWLKNTSDVCTGLGMR